MTDRPAVTANVAVDRLSRTNTAAALSPPPLSGAFRYPLSVGDPRIDFSEVC